MPDVRDWLRNRERNSVASADVNLRNLMQSLHAFRSIDPPQLLSLSQKELEEFMQDYVDFFLRKPPAGKGLLASTVSKYVDSVRSFLQWHGRKIERPLRIPDADDNPLAQSSGIPTQEQLAMLLRSCDARTAAIVALEAFSGVRPQVLGRDDGSDGLTLADLPDLVYSSTEASFGTVPAEVKVRKALSKTRKPYTTYIGPEGCAILTAYLTTRINGGERLRPDSPVISQVNTPAFCHRGNIQDSLRIRMRSVGIKSRTYTLRSYFSNRCLVSGMQPAFQQFLMGHKGDLLSRYGLHKQSLPPDTWTEMRRAYERAVPYLETEAARNHEEPRVAVYEALLQVAGLGPEEIKGMDVGRKSPGEIQRLAAAAMDRGLRVQPAASKPSQRVVTPAELAPALEDGWSFLSELRDGRLLIQAPGKSGSMKNTTSP